MEKKKEEDEKDWFDTMLWIRKLRTGDMEKGLVILLLFLAAAICFRAFVFPVI